MKSFTSILYKTLTALMIVMLALTGLPVSPAYAATAGPNHAGVGANVNGPGTVAWTNSSNIILPVGGTPATAALGNNAVSDYLQGTSYGFAIPLGATINGITVTINRQSSSSTGGSSVDDSDLFLLKAGAIIGTDHASGNDWPTTMGTATYGGVADLWGTTWTPAEINATNFGVSLSVLNESGFAGRTASVDYIQVTITYSLPTTTVGDGTSPSSKAVGASSTNNAVSSFTIATTSGTDTVTGLVVTGGGTGLANVAANGVKLWRDNGTVPNEWDAGDTAVTGGTASFAGTTATFSGLSIPVTTSSAQYIVTYNIVAVPSGGTMTAAVSGVTATNTIANSDNTDATLTIGFTITTSVVGGGGTITATMVVAAGATPTIFSTPNTGFVLANILVDDLSTPAGPISVGRANTYTFPPVNANYTISATFDGGWYQPSTVAAGSGWVNTGNGFTSNNAWATSDSLPGANANYINFNIPTIPASSIIDGIEVAYEGWTGSTDATIALSGSSGSGFSGTSIPTTFVPDVPDTTVILGGPLNTWGSSTWASNDFTNAEFYVRVSSDNLAQLNLDQVQVRVHYRQPTTLTVGAATGTYGGTVNLTGTLLAGATPVSGQTVTFYLNGVSAGTAVTNASGVATLSGVSLAGINAGTYPGIFNTSGVVATYGGTAAGVLPGYLASNNAVNTLTVNPATVVPSITANDKPYDGTTAATIATRTLTGVLGTDVVTLTGGTATFANANVGTWTVTAAGLTLSGADAGNYQLSTTTATDTADITAKMLIPGITADNKPYDGTTAATIATRTLIGVVGTEDVTLTGGTATFADPNVGTWTVTATGLALSGADAGNYQLSSTTATTTADITAAVLTPSITANDKPYDGTTAATIATRTLTGVLGTEDVTLTGGIANFADPNVGTWTVTATGLTLSGADAGNYQLSTTTATATADITAKTLIPVITANDKPYDGTTAATIATRTLIGVVGTEDVSLTGGTATFANANVGTWTVTATGLTLSGADAGNYQLSTTTATDTADITARILTPIITADNKPYDGTTAATIATRTLSGVVGTEDVTLTGGTATFADPNVGTWTVTATGLTLSGADAGNYQLSSTTATTTADITAAVLTPSITANDKPYDGTTVATIATRTLTGVLGTEDVTLTGGIAIFADPNVGTWTVTATGLVLSGADAGNYQLSTTTATATADITAKTLIPVITADDKPYDGTTAATIATRTLIGVVGTEDVTLTGGTATFANANVGTWTVTATGLALSGADAGNYQLSSTTATDTADITAAAILIPNITADNKVYDGTTAATIATRTLSGVIGTDDVTLTGGTATFANANVGTWTVTAINLTLSGVDAGNYQLSTTTATATADITAATLTPSITASDKVYDGTTAATIATRTLAGVIGLDNVALTGGTATFANANVGTWTVTATGLTLSGADAGNYQLSTTTATTTADITLATATISITSGSPFTFDGTPHGVTGFAYGVGGISDVLAPVVTFSYSGTGYGPTATPPTDVETYTVTVSFAGNANYAPTSDTATIIINPVGVTVDVTGGTFTYDGNPHGAAGFAYGVGGPSDVQTPAVTFTYVGTGTTVYPSSAVAPTNAGTYNATASFAGNVNYSPASNIAAITITKRPIEFTAVTDTKPYDGNTSSSGVPTLTAGTLVGTDDFTLTQTFDTKDAGTGKDLIPLAVISVGNANNYTITYVNDPTGEITAIPLTISNVTANGRIYDGTTDATLNTGTAALVGVLGSDVVTLNSGGAAGTFADKNVGPLKPVTVTGFTIGGADAGNYTLTQPADLKANITVLPITVTAQTNTKVYDSTTSSAAVPLITAGSLAPGDTASFTQTYDNKNVGTSKILTPSGAVTDGNLGGNYSVTFANDGTGIITTRPLTITAAPQAKALGAVDPPLTYSITNGSLVLPDALSGSLTRAPGESAGTYAILQGTVTAGPNYNLTYVGANLVIGVGAQAITVGTSAPANAAYNTNFNVTATATSGLPVTITTTGGACSGGGVNGIATITMLSGTGICTVHFNQAGDANFTAATEIIQTTTAQKANQTINVNTPAPANATYNTGFNVAATATSGLPVAYTAAGVCTNVGSNYTVTSGTGTCTVQYNQAGNANYNAAPQVTNTTNAQKANQSINVTTSAPASAVFGSNFTVAANATSGLAVAYSAAGSCSNAGAAFTMTLPTGVCTVQINQAGNANYNAATQVTQTVNAQKANQTITVTTSAPGTAPFGTVFTVAATSSSGLPVTYTAAGSCTNVGATFTVTSSSGSCTVQYNQAGNANYNAAPQVAEFTNSLLTNQTINVTTPAPANAVFGSTFTVAATASSALPVTYTAVGSCTNVGATFTMTASTGTCTVQYNQAGNINFNPAPQVTNTTNAQKVNQTITVTTPAPATAANGANFTVAATASSGLPVVYSATGSCANVGGTFTMTSGAGTCTVHYNQPGNANYNAAPEITSSVASQAGSQTINVTTSAPASAANGTSFNVAATSSSGLAVAIITTGDCSGSGSGSASITITSTPGTCTVHYNQAGDANFSPAAEVTEDTSAVIDINAPAVTVNQAASQVNDPTNATPINFTVVFSETVTGFTAADVTIGGTAGATTAVITGAGPTYNVAISGMSHDGTVIVSIPAGAAADPSSNGNSASTSTDNTVTFLDATGPNVQEINTSPETTDHVLSSAETVTFNITQFTVKFNQVVYNPAGDSDPDDVTNPNNYILIRDLGDTVGLQTVSCSSGVSVPADTKIAIGTVTYDNATATATFTVNGGLPLANGDYHLFVCGTTSIVDPLDNALALVGSSGQPSSDYRHSFTVNITGNSGGGTSGGSGNGGGSSKKDKPNQVTSSTLIPVTGFAPGQVTLLPIQPANEAYKTLDEIRIEIPTLGINFPIVGVSLSGNNWNLTWLKDSVGYLEGSAYPTFNGNSVLTAHVIDSNNNLGPFSDIKGLKLGDKIYLHAYGKIYVYEVQVNRKISPANISTVFKHQEYSWITLVTCEDYDAKAGVYKYRRMVRAVLISVVPVE